MKFPISINLLYAPANAISAKDGVLSEGSIVKLTDEIVSREMGVTWWNDRRLDATKAATEIDRNWTWRGDSFDYEGREVEAVRLAIVTADGAVQGAATMTADGVLMESAAERNNRALFVERLFAAPRNRPEILASSGTPVFRGTGLNLIRAAVHLSISRGYGGRLKLDASPRSVKWYSNRGFLPVSSAKTVYDLVPYTPMELPSAAVNGILQA